MSINIMKTGIERRQKILTILGLSLNVSIVIGLHPIPERVEDGAMSKSRHTLVKWSHVGEIQEFNLLPFQYFSVFLSLCSLHHSTFFPSCYSLTFPVDSQPSIFPVKFSSVLFAYLTLSQPHSPMSCPTQWERKRIGYIYDDAVQVKGECCYKISRSGKLARRLMQ
jgi:hypothetical protein